MKKFLTIGTDVLRNNSVKKSKVFNLSEKKQRFPKNLYNTKGPFRRQFTTVKQEYKDIKGQHRHILLQYGLIKGVFITYFTWKVPSFSKHGYTKKRIHKLHLNTLKL